MLCLNHKSGKLSLGFIDSRDRKKNDIGKTPSSFGEKSSTPEGNLSAVVLFIYLFIFTMLTLIISN